jgi:uncharacterized protein (DUF2236 family)
MTSPTPSGPTMPACLSGDDLERALARARRLAAGEAEGLLGPDSAVWRVDREAAIFLGAGRALLLQLAHPWVAAGIAEHSRTLRDPVGRFHRTFAVMFTFVFGGLDQAVGAARRLHERHARIRGVLPEAAGRYAAGSAYAANAAPALRWVHATLVDAALVAHDLVLPPLGEAERERYYVETRLLGLMAGLGPEDLPPTFAEFSAFFDATLGSDELAVTAAGRAVAEAVLAGAGSRLRAPGWYRALTASLLPEPLRSGFGLPFGEAERRRAERALGRLRRLYPALPARLRHVGPYQEAIGRLAGRPRPDTVTRALNRLWIGRPAMPPGSPGR